MAQQQHDNGDIPKSLINLFRGWPHPSLHPVSALKSGSATVLSDPNISTPALGYGPDDGHPPLREEIAKWLTDFYSPVESVGSDRICITGGASQNLACLLQVFSDPVYTRNVWMVAPTYYLACRIFDDAGFAGRLRAVPEDEEGLDIEYLTREISRSEMEACARGNSEPKLKPPRPWRRTYKHIIYATPTFSNPSGKVMSLRRREQLVRLARLADALVIADDVYDHLVWPSTPPPTPLPSEAQEPQGQPEPQSQAHKAIAPRLVDIDRFLSGGPIHEFGNCVSNGSFSKLIGAGCRVGWAEGTEKLAYGVSQAGSSRSGGAPSQLTSTFVCQLLSTNFLQTYIPNVITPTYARRYHILSTAVEKYLLPLGVERTDTETKEIENENGENNNNNSNKNFVGGYFIWLRLPSDLTASQVTRRAKDEENLLIGEGNLFRVEGENANGRSNSDDDGDTIVNDCLKGQEDLENYIRICISYEEEDKLEEGIRRLAAVLESEKEKNAGLTQQH